MSFPIPSFKAMKRGLYDGDDNWPSSVTDPADRCCGSLGNSPRVLQEDKTRMTRKVYVTSIANNWLAPEGLPAIATGLAPASVCLPLSHEDSLPC